MKIHIFGATCVGTTTLGNHLSKILQIPYYDSDDFFWEESEKPYTVRRDPNQRNSLLEKELANQNSWLLGGSIINWKLPLSFDLAVFLWIPQDIRIERLKKREQERFGEVIYINEERNKQFQEFIQWASGYDNNTARGRTLAAQEAWLKTLDCPVLEIRGDTTVEERIQQVMNKLKIIENLKIG